MTSATRQAGPAAGARRAPALTHALTLIQPWAHAIEQLGKRIENRGWAPPRWVVGQCIYIHAGAKLDRDSVESLEMRGYDIPAPLPQRSIGSSVVVRGWVQPDGRYFGALSASAARRVLEDEWYVPGQIAWVLDEVRLLAERRPAVGKLGLWEVGC